MHQSFINRFTTVSFTIIVGICAALPIFFLPMNWAAVAAVKGIVLYAGVLIAFAFWLLSQFVRGTITVPFHRTYIWLGSWMILSGVSALFSINSRVSLWGRGFVLDSFATTGILVLFTFLVATFARDQKRLITLFLASFVGAAVTVGMQVLLYVSQHVSFVKTYLAQVSTQGTLVGSWVDFAYFTTFTFILAVLIYEVLSPRGLFKKISLVAMIVSLIVLIFLNFKTAWIIAIISSLLIFVYKSSVERSNLSLFSVSESEKKTSFPTCSFVSLLVGLFFFLSSASIGASITRWSGVFFSDIRPSIASTMHVTGSVLRRDPLMGAGAGRFGDVWNLYHSGGINQTQFWNTTFETGYSFITTLLTTNGPLVTISFLGILVLSVILGFRLFTYQFPDRFSRFVSVAALIMVIAFTGIVLFSSPGISLVIFGLFFVGILLGVSSLVGKIAVKEYNYLKDPRTSFFAILLLIIVTMSSFTAAYFSGNRFASVLFYNRAVNATTQENAQKNLDKAISLSQNDVYWRARAALFAREFSLLVSNQSSDKTALQQTFSEAEQSARAAVAWDATTVNNWFSLSQIYQMVISTEASDAYTAARDAAAKAQEKNPLNPFLSLQQAQVALAKKDTTAALSFVSNALALRPNYIDAFLLRAQIRTIQGENRATISELNTYVKNNPLDPQGFFLLGQAYASVKEYQSALDAFIQARGLASTDPTTYLAVIDTLTALGQKTQALDALDVFTKTFPGITGIDQKRIQIQSASTPVAPEPQVVSDTEKKQDTKKKTR